MNNVIKFTMVASVLALLGCTDNNVSGAAIEDNAVAQNSSSSKANGSSNSMNGPSQIVFSTKATKVMNVDNVDISVYGEENGAEAACTADEKSYEAKLKVNDGLVENSIEMKNFGSSCDSVLAEFVASCESMVFIYNGNNKTESCDENGNVTAYCFDDRAVGMTICTNNVPGTCSTKPAEASVDFNELFKSFSKFSGNVCNAISKGASSTTGRFTTPSSTSRDMSSSSTGNKPTSSFVDPNIKCLEETGKKCNELEMKPVDPRQELPSYSAIGVDTNSNRSFVIKPNVDALNVSDAERSILDSLARAYPQKTKTDAIDGMTLFLSYVAEYPFTTEQEEYYVRGDGSERSEIDVYREEKGVKSSMVLPLDVYYGGQGYISVTTLQVSEFSILYLVRATLGSYASLLIDTFRTECEATSGSFYEYGPAFMADVAVACAVKNFSGITFDGILGQQKNLFRNAFATFVQPVVD
ncbi:hypothetical protein SAMN06298224_1338 [Fibrobacter sp. UWB16]|uniref:hypothetical protein n=1 Tax=Fibrobacter sp. UWB16 TaxID=1945874 RepID=UPI000BDAE6C4|nr:hypothetical protein [Fibrobacter sp. UWB16]SOD13613.1 hypothetical protein SAMN06298224_1338 [Fibrobacter sp. UWB16]